jgi:hypothetical protein
MTANDLLTGLPGEKLVREGLVDAHAGRCTIPACLVAIGRPRLERAGLLREDMPALQADAELQLYRLLGRPVATRIHATMLCCGSW